MAGAAGPAGPAGAVAFPAAAAAAAHDHGGGGGAAVPTHHDDPSDASPAGGGRRGQKQPPGKRSWAPPVKVPLEKKEGEEDRDVDCDPGIMDETAQPALIGDVLNIMDEHGATEEQVHEVRLLLDHVDVGDRVTIAGLLTAANAELQRVSGQRDAAQQDAQRLTGEHDEARQDAQRLTGQLDEARQDAQRLTGELGEAHQGIIQMTGVAERVLRERNEAHQGIIQMTSVAERLLRERNEARSERDLLRERILLLHRNPAYVQQNQLQPFAEADPDIGGGGPDESSASDSEVDERTESPPPPSAAAGAAAAAPDPKQCPVCLDDDCPRLATLAPCGHGLCPACIRRRRFRVGKQCPVCRERIAAHVMRTYH